MEVQQGEVRQRRPGGVRLGAGRLMTYKEGNDLPEHALKEELAKLESRRERMEHYYKKESEVIETILLKILDSLGNYVNLDTRESVHESLKKEVMRTLVSSRKAEPVLPELDETDENDPDKPKIESHVAKKIKAAKKRKAKQMQALRPRKTRPSYKALIDEEKRDRRKINLKSYVSLLQFHGLEDDAERINRWVNFLYPTTGEHSATICGIKKRLDRYKNRLLLDSNPKDYGVDWFLNESKVVSKYPEAVRLPNEKRHRSFLPPIGNGHLTTIKSEDSSSSHSSKEFAHREESRESRRGAFKKEPISAGEFVFGTRPRSQKSNLSQHSDPIDTVLDAQNGHDVHEEDISAPSLPPKGILLSVNEDPEKEKRTKKVSINAPADDDLDEKSQISFKDGETRDETDRRRRSDFDIATLEKRKKSLTTKVDEKRQERLDYLKSEVAKATKLKEEGRENEIDFNEYFQRRKSLAMLLDEDESFSLFNDEEFKKTWEDVQKCKYIRGYEPPEMRVATADRTSEFVFWKGDFEREESFVTKRKNKEPEEKGVGPSAEQTSPRARRKSLADGGRRQSLADIGRKQSVAKLM